MGYRAPPPAATPDLSGFVGEWGPLPQRPGMFWYSRCSSTFARAGERGGG